MVKDNVKFRDKINPNRINNACLKFCEEICSLFEVFLIYRPVTMLCKLDFRTTNQLVAFYMIRFSVHIL